MPNLSLFNISMEFHALNDLLEDEFDQETGELIDKSEEIKQLWSELDLNFKDKLDNCKRFIDTLDGEKEVLDKEIRRLQAKKKATVNKIDRLKVMMLNAIKTSGEKSIKTDFYTFSTRKSEAVKVIDEDLIARNFLKIKYEADKTKIKKAIKEGESVEGATIVENESLTIR